MEKIELKEEYPARIADMLLNDEIDVGLVPVAVIPKLKDPYIITDYCIGTDGEVASVALFSEAPMEEITHVVLDYQSRTSVRLARLLLKEYWKKQVVFSDGGTDIRSHIAGTVAGVIIGDRALEQRAISAYCYDLGAAWKEYTGLPFVFAAWVANKPVSADFEDAFNRANGYGIRHLEDVIKENPYDVYDLHAYYTGNISYELTEEKRKGLALFLQLLKEDQALG